MTVQGACRQCNVNSISASPAKSLLMNSQPDRVCLQYTVQQCFVNHKICYCSILRILNLLSNSDVLEIWWPPFPPSILTAAIICLWKDLTGQSAW